MICEVPRRHKPIATVVARSTEYDRTQSGQRPSVSQSVDEGWPAFSINAGAAGPTHRPYAQAGASRYS